MENYRHAKEKTLSDFNISYTSAAMAMELYCKEHGISGRLIPVPRELSAGCGLAWRIEPEEYARYKDDLLDTSVEIEQNVELMI